MVLCDITSNKSIISSIEKGVYNDYDGTYVFVDVPMIHDRIQKFDKTLPLVDRKVFEVSLYPEPLFIDYFNSQGFIFNCAEWSQVDMCLKSGVSADDIIFTKMIKSKTEIKAASDAKIKFTTVDSVGEIEKVAFDWPNANVFLVIDGKQFNSGVDNGARSKWGVLLAEVNYYLEKIDVHSLTPCGLMLMADNEGLYQIAAEDNAFYTDFIRSPNLPNFGIADCLRCLQTNNVNYPPLDMIFVDFRGVLMDISLTGYDERLDFLSHALNQCQDECKNLQENKKRTKLLVDIGRYYTEPACYYLAKVMSSRSRIAGNGEELTNYHCNDGINGYLMASAIFPKRCLPMGVLRSNKYTKWTDLEGPRQHGSMFGPTMDALDKICETDFCKLNLGDWLVWPLTGSYNFHLNPIFSFFGDPKIIFCN